MPNTIYGLPKERVLQTLCTDNLDITNSGADFIEVSKQSVIDLVNLAFDMGYEQRAKDEINEQ